MAKILAKNQLADNIIEYIIDAPLVAKNAMPGQFVIIRVDDRGERIPLTLCGMDAQKGTVTLLVQTVGYTTHKLARLVEGDSIADIVGPLGLATRLDHYKNICLVGGGIGAAVIYPQAVDLALRGRSADVIVGARKQELLVYRSQFCANARNYFEITDDGSSGERGFVTDVLKRNIEAGADYDCVFAVGPLAMMRAVANLTRTYGIKTIVSMNSIMVDGTGMCGGCRLTVDGQVRYACVDGPEFDGHLVDFEKAMLRSGQFAEIERAHMCRLTGGENEQA